MPVNIAQPEAITAYLTAEANGNAAVAAWLNAALTKSLKKRAESVVELTAPPADAPEWLHNKWDVCGPFHAFVPDAALKDKLRHIKDWLMSALREDPDYTTRQRPLDLENAYQAADKYFVKFNQKHRNKVEDDSDTKTVMSFEDGSRIVQLLTTNALKVEGPKMDHCIGGGNYDAALLDGSCIFYSLRDSKNEPHATFEVRVKDNNLLQCKGKQNQPPIQKYMPKVQAFVTQQQFKLEESAHRTGLVQTKDGQYHSIYNLPEDLTIDGRLDLSECSGLTSLPENLSVNDLHLSGCTGLTALPENLSVKFTLDLNGCTGLTALPKNLFVGRNLNLNDCTALAELPENFSVNGSLHLISCTSLKKLPKNLSVNGDLYLGACTNLTTLPEELSISYSLILEGCRSLTVLPEELSINGTLDLVGCPGIKSIPRSLKGAELISTDIGAFITVAEAADAFDAKYGRKPSQPKHRPHSN